MVIIHGENTALSRKKLQEYIDLAKQQHSSIIRLEAKKLTPALLEETMGGTSLFAEDTLIVIEELHSLPTSKRKKALIELLSQTPSQNKIQIVMYEKRTLTKTLLKKFTDATVYEFKISNTLWQFLDTIGNKDKKKSINLLHQSIDQNDVFFVYTMLIRQIRLLLTAKENGKIAGAPFMVSKLKKQAHSLSLSQLLATHHQLHIIDIKQKNSQLVLDLEQELDLLLFKL